MKLFEKNVFSVKNTSLSKLNDLDTTHLSTIIKKNYPEITIREIQQIGAFEINSNNWKIESDKGDFILKRSVQNKFKNLSAQAIWTKQLQENSFPTLQFYKNKENHLISTDDNFIYCITHYENGQYFGSSLEEWSELIKYIKQLSDYCLKNESSDILTRDFFTSSEDKLIDLLKSFPEINHISSSQLSEVISTYEKQKEYFKKTESKFHKSVFHVDIHPHNLIFNNNKLVLLTDFESFQSTIIEISLGFGLYKCMRELLTMVKEDVRPIIINQLKSSFENIFTDLNFKQIINHGIADIIKRILYVLNELVEKKKSEWLFVLDVQLTALEEINEINRHLK